MIRIVKKLKCIRGVKGCKAVSRKYYSGNKGWQCAGIKSRPHPPADKIRVCDSSGWHWGLTPDEAIVAIHTIGSAVEEWMMSNRVYQRWRKTGEK